MLIGLPSLNKEFTYLRSGSKRHRHFIGFFNVPVEAPTRGHPLDLPTDPVELPVVEQPVPAPQAAEAGGFLSSLRSFGGSIVTKGREILSVGLEGVRSVPQVGWQSSYQGTGCILLCVGMCSVCW